MSIQRNIQKSFLMGSTALTRPAATLGAMAAMVLGSGSAFAIDANTLPSGGTVTGGAATISQSGSRLDVNQSTNRTVLDWRSFDIGENAHVNFNQPNSGSIAVNRINQSTNPTQINGQLTANGHVWVLNPNGVMFGASARVDVSGLVASTANINVDRFMAGDTRLDLLGAGGGSVVNEGQITVREGGLAAFVAPHVRNNGTIRAKVGKVAMAAGETFTLDLAGDRLIEIGLGADGAKAEQLGQVVAEGGVIEISAKAATQVVDSIVNVEGITSAASATVAGGEIILGGGEVNVAGTLDASGATGGGSISIDGETITTESSAVLKADATDNGDGGSIIAYADGHGDYAGSFSAKGGANGGDGGFVETSGETVKIDSDISVNTLAPQGSAGNWTIDPDDLSVVDGTDEGSINPAASTINNATIVTQLATTGVTLAANNSISVDAEIDSSGQGSSTTLALNDEDANNDLTINLNAAITLGANQTLTGEGTVVNVNNGTSIQNGVDVAASGAQLNVSAGNYEAGTVINKALTVSGGNAAQIDVAAEETGLHVTASNVSISGFSIVGPFSGQDFRTIDWDSAGNSYGVRVTGSVSNTTISGNNIQDIRSGIWIGDATSGAGATVTGNTIDNTKGAVLVYGSDLASASGNQNGTVGNEWGFVLGLDATSAAGSADATRQGELLAYSLANNEMSVFDRAYGQNNRTHIFVDDDSTATAVDDFNFGNGLGNERQPLPSIQAAIYGLVSGGWISVADGTYTLGSTLDISKSLTLTGESQTGTIINAATSGYGIQVTSNNVTLSDFTLNGPSANLSSSYGIKVSPTGAASNRLNTFNISDVTIQGSGRAELDLNGVVDAHITNVTADGQGTAGAGIQITDSADVWLTGVTTRDNLWGGVALYQANRSYDQQTTNININAAENTFNEFNGLFAQDESDGTHPQNKVGPNGLDFGTLNLIGFTHIVENADFRNGANGHNNDGIGDQFTFFRTSLADALNYAVNLNDTVTDSSVIGGWNGTDFDGNFYVGTHSGTAMSIQAAVDAADDGNNINVLAGSYDGGVRVNKNDLTVSGAVGAVIDVAAGLNGFEIQADGVSISGFDIIGLADEAYTTYSWGNVITRGIAVLNGSENFEITNNNILGVRNGILIDGRNTGVVSNNVIDNTKSGISVQYTDGAGITIANNEEGQFGNEWGVNLHLNGYWDGVTVTSGQGLLGAAPSLAWQQALLDLSSANDGWSVQDQGYTSSNRTHVAVSNAGSDSNQGSLLSTLASIQAAFNSVVAGGYVQVAEGTYAGTATTGDLVNILGQNATVGGLTLNGAGSMIGGSFSSAVSGFTFGAPIILGDNLTLTTTGPATITAGAIDAETAGAQTLTVNAGGTASFGSLGGTARLGATSITGAGTTLTGTNYNANSLTFGGPVTLTQGLTSFNSTISGTQAGNITFTGNIFGTANGAQSLNLIAGNGAGAKSSNGDVSIQNAGTQAVQLGGLTVNADDFSAATVWLAGDYNGTMTGNQTFTDETLNAGGNVSSTVGGNASGPINSGGNVTVNSGGNVSGNVSGNNVTLAGQNVNSNVTANQTANITAQNSVSGNVSAGSGGTINAGTVNTNLSGGGFTVNASGGSVTGNPSGLNTSGSGSLKVNGQTVVGSSDADFNQIVVEGFTLPAGAIVTDTGEIVLPQGLAIGLISPAAGEGSEGAAPRVIFVRSVQRLGALLAEGYSAIVIDLNEGVSEEEQEMAMAQ
ncbi:beta strand repeat-containing protein [Tepidicaulis sp.]|uniref:beta strand repeat-containing protein n=1 Tax=Tepidicaulis sp. TaxID=1920809 RepID=UPI003B58CFFD